MRPTFLVFAVGSAVLAAGSTSAALPPPYQRLAELKAVIADPAVAKAFGEMPVERVEFVRQDLYRVSGRGCRLDLAIVDLPTPPGVSGGRRFAVRAGQKVCGR